MTTVDFLSSGQEHNHKNMMLGIDENQKIIYEGYSLYGRAIWPAPIVSQMVIVGITKQDLESELSTFTDLYSAKYIFREDTYDPVTRVRRGRVYTKGQTQPQRWRVIANPLLSEEASIYRQLATFNSNPIKQDIDKLSEQALVLLGTRGSFTIWTIINIEKIVTGEELVTLKARQTYGSLPELDVELIPENKKRSVLETLKILTDEIHRAGPESVIDRARDAVAAMLACYLDSIKKHKVGKDLAELISELDKEEDKKNIVINAAHIVRIFHSRAKPSVKEKHPVRTLVEQDAELAVQCVGTILCDLKWARWP